MANETLQFRTELKQILDIIIHSLYSHPEIFLRELISNASDAIDTLRFQSLTQSDLASDGSDWKIKIIANESAGTLTVSDNGIGMSRDAVIENLGTIARSGTKAFLENLRQADAGSRPELIGQFGVGFYSSFMVADQVTVESRAAGAPPSAGVRWESNGQGEFSVTDIDKPARGTDVILHLKPDAREFLKEWKIRELVRQYSDFVEHPIVMDVSDDKETHEETLNSRKAIWLRPKGEITPEDYTSFYQHLSHDYQEPAKVIHYAAEGTIEFRALLFLPAHRPLDMLWGDSKRGLQLYIRRVFIMDDCEALLPTYLRFVRGVVDSPDLPLNVSREMLQRSAPLEKIKANLTNKVLKSLEEMKNEEFDKYASFFKELGIYLKEGIYQDPSHRDLLADLLLVESTATEPGKYTTLPQYVEKMKPDQKEIYYLIGENRELLLQSPYLESVRAQDLEVLLFTEPVDELVTQSLGEYKGKKLKAIDKGALAADAIPEEKKTRLQPLLDVVKQNLPEIKEARLSTRLKESAVCLVADENAPGAHMERVMQRLGRAGDIAGSSRILEINPDHPVIGALAARREKDAGDPRLASYIRILYDQAVLAEGSRLKDPADFAKRVNELLVRDAGS
jgi:molecular chaperone HtpG